MKNLKTRIVAAVYAVLFILLMITGTTKVMARENLPMVTVIKAQAPITKIVAKGNVRVYIAKGEEQSIKVYDNYYGKNALTQIEDGVLRITSFEEKALKVYVTVKDLQAVEASDYAYVYAMDKFRAINFEVTLKNQATAVLNVDAFSINTHISDTSRLQLKGSAEYGIVLATDFANIDITKFEANHDEIKLYHDASITLNSSQNSAKMLSAKSDDMSSNIKPIRLSIQ
ncbi:MAG: DUF2807 domain-containing protein [Sphingobacteriales bacterium]|nr:DUF2807 domain-containing protein [Sphingobacteriales bacterium]